MEVKKRGDILSSGTKNEAKKSTSFQRVNGKPGDYLSLYAQRSTLNPETLNSEYKAKIFQ